jgi:hypothetical protein
MPCNHRQFRLCADLRVVCGIGENDQAFVRELGDLVFDGGAVGRQWLTRVAMDFKLDEQEAGLLDRANIIAKEMEAQIPEKSKLFEPAR